MAPPVDEVVGRARAHSSRPAVKLLAAPPVALNAIAGGCLLDLVLAVPVVCTTGLVWATPTAGR